MDRSSRQAGTPEGFIGKADGSHTARRRGIAGSRYSKTAILNLRFVTLLGSNNPFTGVT